MELENDYRCLINDITVAINGMPGGRTDAVKVYASTAFLDRYKRGNRYPTGVMGVRIIPVVSNDIFYCVGYGHYETK